MVVLLNRVLQRLIISQEIFLYGSHASAPSYGVVLNSQRSSREVDFAGIVR